MIYDVHFLNGFVMSMYQELLHDPKRKKSRVIRVIEGYETGLFKSKFTGWVQGEEPEDD